MTNDVQSEVRSLGLVALAVVGADPPMTYDVFCASVASGLPEGLGYLQQHAACRRSFEDLLPGTQSLLVAAMALPPAVEGWGRFCVLGDYHDRMRAALRGLAAVIEKHFGVIAWRACVDSAPILEREWAVRGGLGWIGHQRMLLHPDWGSALILGELLVNRDLTPHQGCLEFGTMAGEFAPRLHPGAACRCSVGHRPCVNACPTGALTDDGYCLRRCLAYWTTQHRGPMPEPYARAMGSTLWGCDHCQRTCPAAHYASTAAPHPVLDALTPECILDTSQKQLRKKLTHTPMAGAHPHILQRNACLVIGNLRQTRYVALLEHVEETHPCGWVRDAAQRSLHCLKGIAP